MNRDTWIDLLQLIWTGTVYGFALVGVEDFVYYLAGY